MTAILGVGACLFLLFVLLQAVYWRISRPRNEPEGLAMVLLGTPGAALLVMSFIAPYSPPVVLVRENAFPVFLLYVSLAGAYIAAYPAAQARSPSLQIMLLFKKKRSKGLTYREISDGMEKESLVADRIGDVKKMGLVRESKGRMRLTPIGNLIVRTFRVYRRYLGLPLKGG